MEADLEKEYADALAVVCDGDRSQAERDAASRRLAELAPEIAKQKQDELDEPA